MPATGIASYLSSLLPPAAGRSSQVGRVPAPLPLLPLGGMMADDDDDDGGGLDDLQGGYTPYLGRLTAVACLGGLQFGWDTGIAAGMLVAIHQDLGHTLSATEQEIIVSATTVGAILGALVAGRLSDRLGRKKVMIAAGVFFTLGSMEQAASQVVRELVLGRVLVGLGVGMASMIVPTYLAECAPTSIRGRIIAINSLLITGGQVVAYVVDAAFYHLPHGWRWMVLAGGVPALVQLVGLFYLDESPRWLISRGRHTAARRVLSRIYPLAGEDAIASQLQRIEQSLDKRQLPSHHRSGGRRSTAAGQDIVDGQIQKSQLSQQLASLWHDAQNRRALLLSCGLQAGQQLVGANSILYFSSRLLLMAGFKANPNLAAVSVAVANLIGTALALRLVDRIGRRRLLLNSLAAAVVALAFLSLALSQIRMDDVTDSSSTLAEHPGASAWAYLSLIAMVAFLFFYALGIGIVPWLVQSEIFAGDVRGVGGGLATATNWTCNLIISATYLDLVSLVTPAGSFGLFALVGILIWLFAYYHLPELSGVSLNDVHSTLSSRGGSSPSARQGQYHAVHDETDENGDSDEE